MESEEEEEKKKQPKLATTEWDLFIPLNATK